jgi:hypothetical protein
MKGRSLAWLALVAVTVPLGGCATTYKGVVRPTPKLGLLSKELGQLTDAKIEIYLKAQVQPSFPTVLAVAKLPSAGGTYPRHPYRRESSGSIEVLQAEEAAGWRTLAGGRDKLGRVGISQVQFLSPMLLSESPTLKSLRDAAALVHAPMLLVYLQEDNDDQGLNSAAMAYWSIVGLFFVPGNTVGRYSACQAVLVDTQTGFVLATAQGESRVEENVLPGAVDIARRRVDATARRQACANLVANVRETLQELIEHPQTLPATDTR